MSGNAPETASSERGSTADYESNNGDVSTHSPVVCDNNGDVSTHSPVVCDNNGDVSTHSPVVCDNNGDVFTHSPVVCDNNGDVFTHSPVVCDNNGDVFTHNPVVCDNNGDVFTHSPVVCNNNGDVFTHSPVVFDNNGDVSTHSPVVFDNNGMEIAQDSAGIGSTIVEQESQPPLSPNTLSFLEKVKSLPADQQTELHSLVRNMESNEVRLKEGKIEIIKGCDKNVHMDMSKANTIQDCRTKGKEKKIAALFELIDHLKANITPRGLHLSDKVHVSRSGEYREGVEFENLKTVLGSGNCAGDIVVVKDLTLQTEHAMKTMMVAVFRNEELEAMIDLQEIGCAPELLLVRLENNKIIFHMEKITGVTMNEIIEKHMSYLMKQSPDLVQPFSLCVLHSMLSEASKMHRICSHNDFHGGNVMLDTSTMRARFLDFGLAQKFSEDSERNHATNMKKDILNIVNLFLEMFTGCGFGNALELENHITSGLACTFSPEVHQILQLVGNAILNPSQEGFGDLTDVLTLIEILLPERTRFESGIEDYKKEVISKASGNFAPKSSETEKELDKMKDTQNLEPMELNQNPAPVSGIPPPPPPLPPPLYRPRSHIEPSQRRPDLESQNEPEGESTEQDNLKGVNNETDLSDRVASLNVQPETREREANAHD